MSSDHANVFEVGPRDGLQNEKQVLSLVDKLWLIRSLVDAGVKNIETGSFVRPDKVPQMADSDQVCLELSKADDARFWYLVPNVKGFEKALAAGAKHIAVFTAASETFNQKNIGMSIDESFKVIQEVVALAAQNRIKVRGYVSTVWGCPFEGKMDPQKALFVIERMLALPIEEISIGDTIGVAAPVGVQAIFKPLLKMAKAERLAAHFHDTRGAALANALQSYELGIRTFDSSLGGLGGCPFAPGASGNLATEDLIYLFKEMGIETGVNYAKLCETSIELSKRMGNRPLQSRALRAYQTNCAAKNEWDL